VLWAGQRTVTRYCPVCEHAAPVFLPFGVGLTVRLGALCPFCRSLERHRAVWLYLYPRLQQVVSEHGQTRSPRLLHVAPEVCFRHRLRRLLGQRYVTTDLVAPDVDVNAPLEQLPFASESFDVVVCNHVLEHVPDDRSAMDELLRVLVPGGWAIVQVPIAYDHEHTREDPSESSPRERKRRFGQHDHVRWYGRDYPERLRAAGFEIEQLAPHTQHTPAELERYGLSPTEVLYVAHKPRSAAAE
jgi:SAM-dependent methyltransferase